MSASNTPNWGQLFAKGRCRGVGIPWSQEESYAVGVLGIPAEVVRKGIVTKEAHEKYIQDESRSPSRIEERKHLEEQARKRGITVTPNASDADIERAIRDSERGVARPFFPVQVEERMTEDTPSEEQITPAVSMPKRRKKEETP